MGLFKAISNFFRGQADKAATALEDVERDSKFAIEDSKKQIAEFQSKIARIMAQNKLSVRDRDAAQEEVEKLQGMAERAAAKKNEQHVRELVNKKATAQRNLDTLNGQITKNEAVIKQLRAQLDANRTKIANAESNRGRLVATLEGAKIREEMATAASGLDTSSPLAALDRLERKVNEAEANAEVAEELAGAEDTSTELEGLYSDSASDVDDEVARLMGKPTGTSSGS